jgi:hypothetical protein
MKTVPNAKKSERSWLAIGSGSLYKHAKSDNGTSWTGITKPGSSSYSSNAVAYGNDNLSNGLWILAGGQDGGANALMTSSNRTTWTPVTCTLTQSYDIAYGKDNLGSGLWVAVGNGGNTIVKSSDGTIWTNASSNVFGTASYQKVAYGKDTAGNGLWIACVDNKIARSANGTVWTDSTQTILSDVYGIAYGKDNLGNGLWVIIGSGSTNAIASSSDGGATWYGRGGKTNMFNNYGLSVFYANNLWVAVGYSTTKILTSTDGFNWTAPTIPTDFSVGRGVRYGKDNLGNGLWVVNGEATTNAFLSSTDGTTWTGHGGISGLFQYGGNKVAFSEIIVPP